MVLSVVVLVGLGLFVSQVVQYVHEIKAGGPDPYKQHQLEASVSSLLAKSASQNVDIKRVEAGTNPTLGNPDAKVHIVEFLDYQCPFCQKAAPDVRNFMQHHANDVLLTIRDFPLTDLHPDARTAALAARCVFAQGNPDAYWKYHDLLFSHQDALDAASLRSYAALVNADLTAFDQCIANNTTDPVVQQSIQDGADAGVVGTPTFFINGVRVQGALDEQALETLYQQLKARV